MNTLKTRGIGVLSRINEKHKIFCKQIAHRFIGAIKKPLLLMPNAIVVSCVILLRFYELHFRLPHARYVNINI